MSKVGEENNDHAVHGATVTDIADALKRRERSAGPSGRTIICFSARLSHLPACVREHPHRSGTRCWVVSQQLGHASTKTTWDPYVHLFRARDNADAARCDLDASIGRVLR